MILSTVVRNNNNNRSPRTPSSIHPSIPPDTSNNPLTPPQINATPPNTPTTAPATFYNAAAACAISSAAQMISIAENSRTLFAIRNSMVVLGRVESILLMLRRSFIIAGVRNMGMIRMGGNRLRCNGGGKIL